MVFRPLVLLASTAAVLAVLCTAPAAASFQVAVNVAEKTCFAYEAGNDPTTVTVAYIALSPRGSGQGTINVVSPAKKVISTHDIVLHGSGQKEEETFTFGTTASGRWDVCLQWSGNYALRLELDVTGEVDMNYRDASTTAEDYLSIAARLAPQMEKAEYEVNYLSQRQERFDQTVSSVYTRIIVFTILQAAVMVGTVGWQVWSLRRFFKAKKLA
jgi:hypothetical protein